MLDGGRTTHSTFGIPYNLDADSVSSITFRDKRAAILIKSKLIIVDEASMASAHMVDVIDKLLRELTRNSRVPFGGKTILFAGDFRQTLSIVQYGRESEIIANCFKNAKTWRDMVQFELTENMRANADEIEFKNWLIQIGDGTIPSSHDSDINKIELDQRVVLNLANATANREQNAKNIKHTMEEKLVDYVYGDKVTAQSLIEQNISILSPLNVDVDQINQIVLDRMYEEQEKTYLSTDTHIQEEEDELETFQQEHLNAETPSGFPHHVLNVKVGGIVILLKNLNLSKGQANGSRVQVTRLYNNLIEGKIAFGPYAGEIVLIPRYEFNSNEGSRLPFKMQRIQFPIRLAFAMTINKSQGQTFRRIGVYLPAPVFSHGQLYVALSRVRSFNDVKVLVKNTTSHGQLIPPKNKDQRQKKITPSNILPTYTDNVVYRYIFTMNQG